MAPRTQGGGDGGVPERRDVYERIADELRRDIVSGRYLPGDRLPSTLDLMDRAGVANLTVRGAYRVLVEEGLVEPVAKKGFYVRRPNVTQWRMNAGRAGRSGRRGGPDRMDGWAADAAAAGLRYREEISVGIEDSAAPVVGRPVGERLGLDPGSRVLVRRAIRLLGPADSDRPETPASLADFYFPYDLVRDTALASPGPASAEDALAGLGCPPCRYEDELRPRLATSEERRILGLPQVSVVLELARTGFAADRRALLVSHQILRGDGAIYRYQLG